jgi:serine/threonine protein kinase
LSRNIIICSHINKEITLGRVLGKGGFCVVSEISKITLQKESVNDDSTTERIHDEHTIQNIVQDRSFMETHCLRGKDKDCRYAMKILLQSCSDNEQTYINGVVDLAVEARFLSVIRHPSIIKMRAMAESSPFSTTQPFFVVLDRLYDILGTRITKWKKQKPKGVGKLMDRSGKKENAFWIERITVAYDLASALNYLHESNVVYRDIKPDNIGFDVRGDVKIFDFGLAKEFDPMKQDKDGLYHMTADTGSPRYMAPEVFLGKPYNELVDVYSFSILLWQILQLETPYDGYTMHMLTKKVIEEGSRPKCDPKWSQPVINLIHKGWGDILSRPSTKEILEVLGKEMGDNVYAQLNNIVDASRKSDVSLRNELDRSAASIYNLKLGGNGKGK